VMHAKKAGARLLLFVDQFEELFDFAEQTKREGDAQAFVRWILEAAADSRLTTYVMMTMALGVPRLLRRLPRPRRCDQRGSIPGSEDASHPNA
jgi:hypothetical protein